MADENKKLHIRLNLNGVDLPVYVNPEDEPIYRNAAKLIRETVNAYADRYRTSKSEKEVLYMAMIDLAVNLETQKTRNDTAPYDDILAKITTEIEGALGVKQTNVAENKK